MPAARAVVDAERGLAAAIIQDAEEVTTSPTKLASACSYTCPAVKWRKVEAWRMEGQALFTLLHCGCYLVGCAFEQFSA